jgi:hypothetical protein
VDSICSTLRPTAGGSEAAVAEADLRPLRGGRGDPEILRSVLGVREEYLDTALDEMRTRFGDIEGNSRDGLGDGPPPAGTRCGRRSSSRSRRPERARGARVGPTASPAVHRSAPARRIP